MSGHTNLSQLPADLPAPEEDGGAQHLLGMRLPAISLAATSGELVNLAALQRRTVIYAYPMTGVPGVPLPPDWDAIPGARGCTVEALAFKDHRTEIAELGADVFGLSTQDTAYQQEMADRLHLPFPVLSDASLELAQAMRLPMMEVVASRIVWKWPGWLVSGVVMVAWLRPRGQPAWDRPASRQASATRSPFAW